MKDIEKIKISATSTIEKALSVIDSGAVKIALVVNDDNQLLGTLSDGDIRRGLLNNLNLKDSIKDIYYKNPIIANEFTSVEGLISLCALNTVSQIPILNNERQIIDLFVLDEELTITEYDNAVVLMVGGLGRRLKPLTDKVPKPMLKVGNKPILQTIVEGFCKHGFTNIVMCVGYKSNVIKDYFQDGSSFGVKINYVTEDKRMGTAGALTLLKQKMTKPFFVMNGDLITNVNYKQMLELHESSDAVASMCVRKYDIEVPYGVVNTKNQNIIGIEEKPIHSFFVNAGIYLLDPKCIDLIPVNAFYDMPSLFEKLVIKNEKVVSFPINEYWADVGRVGEYEQANFDYNNFSKEGY